ncbi:MAG TPA: DinB family protein [Gemmatimonadales bacterium]|nr:DinB family protein [Gemmatimonadales bacterium]
MFEAMARNARISLLLAVYDQSFDRAAWHGTPLGRSLREITWKQALKRPGRRRHNIWELVLHLAYWKSVARRRLTRNSSIEFPRSPANFPAVPAKPTAALWRRDVALLKREHQLLRAVISRFPESRLGQQGWHTRWTNAATIYGIASHDLYHTGQIQLIRQFVA